MSLLYLMLSIPLAVLTACLGIEVLLGTRPLRRARSSTFDGTAVVVVPAHNEEVFIEARLRDLLIAAKDQARILVVADNCSDQTAPIARDVGVQVYERMDAQRRGKGYALAAAKEFLQPDPPDIVIILDADCWTDAESLRNLISACNRFSLPVQAAYLQAPSSKASVFVQLSAFAFFVKNFVRQRGLQRLAGRCLLVGSGMAFPWRSFAAAALASSNIVEDLQLGLDLAELGQAPQFVETALVWGPTETPGGTMSQRQRWEGGFLRTAIKTAPRLVGRGLRSFEVADLWAGLSLAIPPLTLLVAVDLVLIALGFALALTGVLPGPSLAPLVASMLLMATGVGAVWLTGGHRFVTGKALIKLPLFLIWKLPMYATFLWKGAPVEWKRTDR